MRILLMQYQLNTLQIYIIRYFIRRSYSFCFYSSNHPNQKLNKGCCVLNHAELILLSPSFVISTLASPQSAKIKIERKGGILFLLFIRSILIWVRQIKYNFSAMTSYDQFLHKLNLIPPQADKILRDIRQLDRQVEEARLQLEPLRASFLQKLANPQQRKTAKSKQEIDQHYKNITKIQNQIELKALQKITLAERLYNLIHQPTQKLQKELHQRGIDKGEEDSIRRKRGKKAIRKPLKKGEWEYDPKQPKYCYCQRPSFGQMVMCDNTFCQLQWFHLQCIEEKKLPEKWFCRNCRGETAISSSQTKKNGRLK